MPPKEFYCNRYLVQIVQPTKNGLLEPLRADVYEILESNNTVERKPKKGEIKHMRFVESFLLMDEYGDNPLTLDELTKKIDAMEMQARE